MTEYETKSLALLERIAKAVEGRPAAKSAASSSNGGAVVPFGKSKGAPISGESDKSLLWLINYAREAVGNPDKARFADSNQALLDACLAEGTKRGIVDDAPLPSDEPPPPGDDDAPF